MKRTDLYLITLLIGIGLIIFYPIFYSTYAYTDDLVGLKQFGRANSSHTLLQYGRYITEQLAKWLFGSITTIKEISRIRLFSLSGWLISIPIWYFIIKKILVKEKLPEVLAFFSVLYLLCSPPVAISISWAACFEMFLANTAGLLSGYLLYAGIQQKDSHISLASGYFIASLLFGIISLFTYQNGFGFFLLPFLLELIAKSKITRQLLLGIGVYFFIYLVYYLLFKYTLTINHVDPGERTGLHINVGNKVPFFLGRPLNSAFHFTYLFNEKSITGIIVYGLLALFWFILSFSQHKDLSMTAKLKYFVAIFCLLGLIYLPSLVVKENYASNRTLFAVDIAVFVLVAQTILAAIQNNKVKYAFIATMSFLFIINAWFNFNVQYLRPVKNEYEQLRKFIENNYQANIDTIYFIRPHEDFFVKKYGITRSWDEFGVPSSFFDWTPGFLVKQIVFEKTGKQDAADKLFVKSWLGKDAFLQSQTTVNKTTMLIDTEQIINSQ